MSFESEVELGISLDQGSLRSARQAIEDEFGDVEVTVSADSPSARAANGGSGGQGGGDAVNATEIAMLEVQRRTLTAQRESADADVIRNEILEDILETLETVEDKAEDMGGGGGGLLGNIGAFSLGRGTAGGLAGGAAGGIASGLATRFGPAAATAFAGALSATSLSVGSVVVGSLVASHLIAERSEESGPTLLGSGEVPFATRTALAEQAQQRGGGRAAGLSSIEVQNIGEFVAATQEFENAEPATDQFAALISDFEDSTPALEPFEGLINSFEAATPPIPDWVDQFLGETIDDATTTSNVGSGSGSPASTVSSIDAQNALEQALNGVIDRGVNVGPGEDVSSINVDNRTDVTVEADVTEVQRELERQISDVRDEIERATRGIGVNP